jgi:hypothetical protein
MAADLHLPADMATSPWLVEGFTIGDLCCLCDLSPEIAERAIEDLLRRGVIREHATDLSRAEGKDAP